MTARRPGAMYASLSPGATPNRAPRGPAWERPSACQSQAETTLRPSKLLKKQTAMGAVHFSPD